MRVTLRLYQYARELPSSPGSLLLFLSLVPLDIFIFVSNTCGVGARRLSPWASPSEYAGPGSAYACPTTSLGPPSGRTEDALLCSSALLCSVLLRSVVCDEQLLLLLQRCRPNKRHAAFLYVVRETDISFSSVAIKYRLAKNENKEKRFCWDAGTTGRITILKLLQMRRLVPWGR